MKILIESGVIVEEVKFKEHAPIQRGGGGGGTRGPYPSPEKSRIYRVS